MDVGGKNGQNCHQYLINVANTFRLQHPSPTSMKLVLNREFTSNISFHVHRENITSLVDQEVFRMFHMLRMRIWTEDSRLFWNRQWVRISKKYVGLIYVWINDLNTILPDFGLENCLYIHHDHIVYLQKCINFHVVSQSMFHIPQPMFPFQDQNYILLFRLKKFFFG